MDTRLAEARQIVATTAAAPARKLDDKVDEMLEIVREIQRGAGRSPTAFDTSAVPFMQIGNISPMANPEIARRFDAVRFIGDPPSNEALQRWITVMGAVPETKNDAPPRTVRHKIGKPKKKR